MDNNPTPNRAERVYAAMYGGARIRDWQTPNARTRGSCGLPAIDYDVTHGASVVSPARPATRGRHNAS